VVASSSVARRFPFGTATKQRNRRQPQQPGGGSDCCGRRRESVSPALGGLDQIFRFTEIGRDGGPFRRFGQISGVKPVAGKRQRGWRRFRLVVVKHRESGTPSRLHAGIHAMCAAIINTRHGLAEVAARRSKKFASKCSRFPRCTNRPDRMKNTQD